MLKEQQVVFKGEMVNRFFVLILILGESLLLFFLLAVAVAVACGVG